MKKIIPLMIISLSLVTNVYARPAFDRNVDPVIIHGTQLSPFIGTDISSLRLYKVSNKSGKQVLEPIPFQINERNKHGDWIFNFDGEGHPLPLKRTTLAQQDELVFMAKDAGIKMGIPNLFLRGDKFIEIILTDPLTRSHAYAYLVFFQRNAPPLSPVKYIHFESGPDRVSTDLYTVGFLKKEPLEYNYFLVPKSAGGGGINLFRGFRMSIDISAFWGKLKIHRDEHDFKSRLVDYILGPIMVIRRVKNSMNVMLGIQSPSILSDSSFYPDYFEFPSIVNIPMNLSILSNGKLLTTTNFNKNAIGMIFYNSNNPRGLKITGKMSYAQKHLNMGPYDWAVIAGPQGAWMNRVVLGKDVPFTKDLYFVDDERKGEIADTGYNFGNLIKAHQGVYTFTSYIYVPVGYKPGDERAWLNIIDYPIITMIYYQGKLVKPIKVELKKSKHMEEKYAF
ncbi:MAG: hypothetical protein M1381_05430 [Deltaproteobacteria bacterium]|nr:hypothetical protein [Deltaproteobacteria bacterium]MCL5792712.1 hypothetical protein [Deltaproteobacteria bacterium]